jgi:hypothetical protein
VRQNKTQTREIILQLDAIGAKKAMAILQAATVSQETDLAKLLSKFLDTNDDNFEARYKIFYDQLAPMVELYRLKPGESLTIKNYSKSGFVKAVNVKVYGTFQFKGLEKSGLAGALSLMDLMSFRDLYGFVTPEKIAETKQLEKQAGVKFVDRAKAEADLFGGSGEVSQGHEASINDKAELGSNPQIQRAQNLNDRTYTPAEINQGVAIEAAVILKDPSKLKQTLLDIQKASDDQHLGLAVVDWQKAAGNIGQFVLVCKLILFFATAVIFVVAIVIINNAVGMAPCKGSGKSAPCGPSEPSAALCWPWC